MDQALTRATCQLRPGISHAELDNAPELDIGDPLELGGQYADLRRRFPYAHQRAWRLLPQNGPPPCGLYQHGLPRSGASGVRSFAWRARVAVEVRYGWLCVVGVSGANAPVNAQPHQKIAAMMT